MVEIERRLLAGPAWTGRRRTSVQASEDAVGREAGWIGDAHTHTLIYLV